MEFTALTICIVIVAMLLSSFVQAAIGFANALIAIPLLLTAGLDLPVAVATTLISSTAQNVSGLYKHRAAIEFKDAWLPATLRLLFLPIGAGVMFWLDDTFGDEKATIRQLMGCILLAIIAMQLAFRVKPKDHIHPIWKWIVFAGAGFLQGSVGLPGPLMVLWIMSHKWAPDRSRAFLFLMFAVCVPLHVTIFCLVWPDAIWQGLMVTLISLPATLIGTVAGLYFGGKISSQLLRRITIGLIIAMSLNAIAMPFYLPS